MSDLNVYTISDKIQDDTRGNGDLAAMDTRFQPVKTTDLKEENEALRAAPVESIGEKWRLWRNVLVIGLAFMLHFTAFWGMSNLQSSVNADGSLGTLSLAAIYGSLIASNIFLPAAVIRWLGCKWTISLSFATYIPFMAAQFYPRAYTLIPAGLIVGLGGGPLWCAKCTYLTVASEAYARATGARADHIVTRFFGVFFMFYQLSQVWGNLISSAVLSTVTEDPIIESLTQTIEPLFVDDFVLNKCGANFCPADLSVNLTNITNTNLKPPSPGKIHLMTGIYLGCMIAAVLIVAFGVDSLNRYNQGRKGSSSGLSGCKLLAVTLKQLSKPYQLLILPITMFIGAEQAFMAADFNAAYISCGWGIANIGFVLVCFGVCNAVAACLIGAVTKIVGRAPVICAALALHCALLVWLHLWRPDPVHLHVYFIVAGLWGVCDAVWLVQINSLSGILFEGSEEASYSNFRLWESTGSVLTYALSPFLCTALKLRLLLGLLVVGVAGYTAIEYSEYKKGNGEDAKRAAREMFRQVDDEEKGRE